MKDGINDPNLQEWLSRLGVPVDDEGIPKLAGAPGPPKICQLCNQLAESPNKFFTGNVKRVMNLDACSDCSQLIFTDSIEFWRRVRKVFK